MEDHASANHKSKLLNSTNPDTDFEIIPKPVPQIRTARLTIRPLETRDDHDLFNMRGREDAMKYSTTGVPDPDINYTRGRLSNFNVPDALAFSVLDSDEPNSRVIGMISFFSPPGTNTYDIGYGLHPDVWRRGYASEAVPATIEAWWKFSKKFPDIDLEEEDGKGKKKNSIFAFTARANAASNGVMRNCGFRLVSEFVDDMGRESLRWRLERPVDVMW